MLENFIIIALATLVGCIYLFWIRSYDKYEKEPIGSLFFALIVGGVISISISLLIYSLVEVNRDFLHAIIFIGPIEEFSKLLALIITYKIIKKDFNEITDGLIYMSAIALGFATIENISYALNSDSPYFLLFIRSIFCILGHIAFSGYMGIAFYIHTNTKRNLLGILIAIGIAALTHGLYDAFIFTIGFNSIVLHFWRFLIIAQLLFLKSTLTLSPYKKKFENKHFTQTNETAFVKCCNCDKSIRPKEKSFENIRFVECPDCKNIVFNGEGIHKILTYYTPNFGLQEFLKKIPESNKTIQINDNDKLKFHYNLTILSAEHSELTKWLETLEREHIEKMTDTSFQGLIMQLLGINKLLKNTPNTIFHE